MLSGKLLNFFLNFFTLKAFLIVISFLISVIIFHKYFKEISKVKSVSEVKSVVYGVEIRLYGQEKLEWIVEGKKLLLKGSNLKIEKPTIKTEGYLIKSEELFLNKFKKRGFLKGNVEIFGKDLYVRTDEAYIDFLKNKAWGNKKLVIRKEKNFVKGKGFEIHFKPFKMSINEVESIHTYP